MTDGAPTPANTDDHSPAALWEAARYAVRWLVNMFGSPVEIAGWGVLAPRERRDMLSWLRPLEGLVRALLVIAAAEQVRAEKLAPKPCAAKRRTRRMVEQDPDASERWCVHFRAVPPASTRGPSARRGAPRNLPNAWPIAERLEAVIRVLENPEPYAQRLARHLHGRPDRIIRALRRPPEHRPPRPGAWAAQTARHQALSAIAAFNTS